MYREGERLKMRGKRNVQDKKCLEREGQGGLPLKTNLAFKAKRKKEKKPGLLFPIRKGKKEKNPQRDQGPGNRQKERRKVKEESHTALEDERRHLEKRLQPTSPGEKVKAGGKKNGKRITMKKKGGSNKAKWCHPDGWVLLGRNEKG